MRVLTSLLLVAVARRFGSWQKLSGDKGQALAASAPRALRAGNGQRATDNGGAALLR